MKEKKSFMELLFGTKGKNSTRIFEIGGTTQEGKPWYVRMGEKVDDSVKKLKK